MAEDQKEELQEISLKELAKLKIGKKTNALYWEGERVRTDSVIFLSGAQSAWAIAVAVFTILGTLTVIGKTYWDVFVAKQPTVIVECKQVAQSKAPINPRPVKKKPNCPVPPPSSNPTR